MALTNTIIVIADLVIMASLCGIKGAAAFLCPSEFIHFGGSQDCYMVIREGMTYDEAQQKCYEQHSSGRLAIVETVREHKYIQEYLNNHKDLGAEPCRLGFWIGLERSIRHSCTAEFHWRRRNGNTITLEPVGVSFFAPGEPNCADGREGCAQYHTGMCYQWNDQNCGKKLCALCEAPSLYSEHAN